MPSDSCQSPCSEAQRKQKPNAFSAVVELLWWNCGGGIAVVDPLWFHRFVPLLIERWIFCKIQHRFE